MAIAVNGNLLRQYIYDTLKLRYSDEPYLSFITVTVDGQEVYIDAERWDLIDPSLCYNVELGYIDVGRGFSVYTLDLVKDITEWLQSLPTNTVDDIATVHIRINRQYVDALKQWLSLNHGEVVNG